MVSNALRHATRIERKQEISDEDRTADRDEAADWIEEHAASNWHDWTFTRIAEETEFSRQHIANTVQAYFQPVTASGNATGTDGLDLNQDEVPEWILDAVKQAYRDGYRDGRADAQ